MQADITEAELRQNVFAKIRNFITVEPVLLTLAIPFYLQTISGQNLALEKSCRVNLQFSTIVCDNMIDKALNGIHCGNIDVTVEQLNRTVEEFEKNAQSTAYDIKNGTNYSLIQQEACRAEIESQKLISTISGYMAPLGDLTIFGIVYLILFLKEPREGIDANQQIGETASAERINFDSESKEPAVIAGRSEENLFESRQIDLLRKKLLEAANNFSLVLRRRRDGMKRTIVWLLLFSNFLFVGCEYEYVNEYFFVRTKLNWEALEESPFAAYSSTTAFLGNILMTTVFSKYFHFADVVIGLISSSFSSVAKLIYITVSTTFMLYVGRSFDLFLASSNVANRCILSTVVDQHEIGRIFSLTALLDNLSKFSFVTIYTNIYKHTVDTFPNAYFIVSFGAIATMAAIFGFLCFHMKDMSTSVTDAVVVTTDSVNITMKESTRSSAEEHQE
ncbi:hypothetical protein HA402_009138 [Bradysia odoriphaga]|nr:hypothetical protein HA402_009138 [Bradysia odoriphaga]